MFSSSSATEEPPCSLLRLVPQVRAGTLLVPEGLARHQLKLPDVSSTTLKRNGKAWDGVLQHHLVGKKVREEKSCIKTMLITFSDYQNVIHKKFLPEVTTMNASRYIKSLIRFMKRLHMVRSQYAQQGSSFFIHDNAGPHTANIVEQFLAKKGGCKYNIQRTHQISILQTSSYYYDSNSL
ncbi:hypothetical protein TNCV_3194421 [Trichonephila clavipes]|uniref:Mariner Mos1 transposase n=1 Tax=Trichonephila clavipes TaxID=2585209 RepID=A0A8X6REB3_TRICX|nr:hypothetical protein TNCV_3194421 [Trichonephila clavipes]